MYMHCSIDNIPLIASPRQVDDAILACFMYSYYFLFQNYYSAQYAISDTSFSKFHSRRRVSSTRSFSDDASPFPLTQRQLSNYQTGTDIMIIYHFHWENVLAANKLRAICQAEQSLLDIFGNCMGDDTASTILPALFNKRCNLTMTYDDALDILQLPENAGYVQDGFEFDALQPSSAILVSYFNWKCHGFTYKQVASKIDKATRGVSIDISYAQIDILNDEATMALYMDVQLTSAAIIATFLVVGYAYVSIGSALVCVVVVAVIASTSLLIDYSFASFGVINLLALSYLSILLGLLSLSFVTSWENIYKKTSPLNRSGQPCRLSHKFLLTTYTTNLPITIISIAVWLTISLSLYHFSPILSISQLGLFLTTGIVAVVICFHVVTIPVWVTVVRLRRLAEAAELLGMVL